MPGRTAHSIYLGAEGRCALEAHLGPSKPFVRKLFRLGRLRR